MTATAAAPPRRIEPNRRDARQAGPAPPEGPARVRRDAREPAPTAAALVLPGEDPDALRARVAAWTDDLRPAGALEAYLVGRAAVVSWQLDRADRTIAARLSDRMRFAEAD